MYAGEPINVPVAVSRGSSKDWAMPKSVSFAVPLPGTHHVARLDVPVHHAGRVRRLQRAQQLRSQHRRLTDAERAVQVDAHVQGGSVDQLHHDERLVVLGDEVEHGDHRGIGELAGDPRLAQHPFLVHGPFVGRDVAGQQKFFDRHVTAEHAVLAEPHDSHAAPAQLADQLVAPVAHLTHGRKSRSRSPAAVTRSGEMTYTGGVT